MEELPEVRFYRAVNVYPKLQQKFAGALNSFGKMSKEIGKIQVSGQSLNFVIFS